MRLTNEHLSSFVFKKWKSAFRCWLLGARGSYRARFPLELYRKLTAIHINYYWRLRPKKCPCIELCSKITISHFYVLWFFKRTSEIISFNLKESCCQFSVYFTHMFTSDQLSYNSVGWSIHNYQQNFIMELSFTVECHRRWGISMHIYHIQIIKETRNEHAEKILASKGRFWMINTLRHFIPHISKWTEKACLL